jgi:tRNA modification GTPase
MGAQETIVAVSTPAGQSLRAVMRLSGPDALACVSARFRPGEAAGRGWLRTFRATRGLFEVSAGGLLAPALLYVMRAPHSYTREDVAEVHLPGSPALLDMALDDVVSRGPGRARPAEPGEFTRRAFMNGRIDLSQAEAVLAVIRAQSESELLAAAAKLEGSVARRCARLQDGVTELRAQAEAALDFAPHGIELIGEAEFLERCARLRAEMASEALRGRDETASDGKVRVVICGAPNAGKSSLLNRLARAEKSIVHPRPGTTRDAVHAEAEVGGVLFRLTDTAGLSAQGDGPDQAAVEQARAQMASCQLLVVVLDGSAPAPRDVIEEAAALPRARVLCVVNKCDLPQMLDEANLRANEFAYETVHTSALTGEGLDGLREALGRTVTEGRLDASAADCLFNARQRAALRRALQELDGAEEAVRTGMGYEFAAVNLQAAADALAEVAGRVAAQDVIGRIFGQFCIGK